MLKNSLLGLTLLISTVLQGQPKNVVINTIQERPPI